MADVRLPAPPRPSRRTVRALHPGVEERGAKGEGPIVANDVGRPLPADLPPAPAGSDRAGSEGGLDLKSRRFLIVTAPFGPFGRVLAEQLEAQGAQVWRMIFNAGDAAYWGRAGGVTWRGHVRDWPTALTGLIARLALTDVVVFGEGGSYNQAVLSQGAALKALAAGERDEGPSNATQAHALDPGAHAARLREPGDRGPDPAAQAARLREPGDSGLDPAAQAARLREPSDSGLKLWVLENGYFRPDWVTVEQDGVNASSGLPRDAAAYDPQVPDIVPIRPVGRILPHHVINISLYHLIELLGRPFYRGYAPPYTAPPWLQCLGHVRRYLGLMLAPRTESEVRVIRARGPFFIACLQREGDAQLLRYSHFADNTAFLAEVLSSFARQAPAEARLVVKNHPLDPGLLDLRRMTRILAVERGIADRVDFIDGGNLAALCRASNGMVVNNSSAALSALGFKTPVKVLGQAFFDIEGLTDQAPLDAFWTQARTPDPDLFLRFRAHVIQRTQVNGNYHEPQTLKPTAKAIAQRFAHPR